MFHIHFNNSFNVFSLIGLLLDFAGVIILFMYGLPSKVRHTGQFLDIGNYTQKEINDINRKNKIIRNWAYTGLIAIIAGFFFQLLGILFITP